jgi:hypothetical protein
MRSHTGSFRGPAAFELCRIGRNPEPDVHSPFLSFLMLAIESQRVIELRVVRLACGGSEGCAEAQSMVMEKINAAAEAMTMLMLGGSSETVIARYREHVAANTTLEIVGHRNAECRCPLFRCGND